MPNYLVLFDRQVIDQPLNPKVCRPVPQTAGIHVAAPHPQGARDHALRVTIGGEPLAVYDVDTGTRVWGEGPDTYDIPPPTPPAIEVIPDTREVFGA